MFNNSTFQLSIIFRACFTLIILGGCSDSHSGKWNTFDHYRWKAMGPSFHVFESEGFREKSADITGINFQNQLTKKQISYNRNLLNGSGVAAGDINGDGLVDLYFARLDGANKLYLNHGNWAFEDVTEKAGLSLPDQYSTGVNFADLDNDSDLDLIVTSLGSTNKIFINNGNGYFKEKKNALGSGVHGSMSPALADIDNDGDLDLYIANYKQRSAKDIYPRQRGFSDIIKENEEGKYFIPDHLKPHYEYEMRGDVMLWFEKGENDLLYKNDGSGNFTKVKFSSGVFKNQNGKPVVNHQGWGLHARFFDINEDGYPDLYVCNDFETPDQIWINQRDGTFMEMDASAIRHLSLSSMSVDFSDIDRDNHYDIFVAEMMSRFHSLRSKQLSTMIPLADTTGAIFNQPLYMGNSLYLNRGDNTFSEIADYSGVRASEWSWASEFMDIDLDGYEDLIIATGNYFDTQDLDANSKIMRKQRMGMVNPTKVMFEYPSLKTQNVIYQNKGDLKFEDKSTAWGFNEKDISHGMAHADLDNDGDQDLIFNRLDSKASIYENSVTKPRIRVSLKGSSKNTRGIGSTIKVKMGELMQKKQVTASGTYLSSSPADFTFAAHEDSAMSIEVIWPDRTKTKVQDVKPNRYYEIFKKEISEQKRLRNETSSPDSSLFVDVSNRLNHEHEDLFFDDFEKQPLLPYKLSQLGPGVSFFDINDDGNDDLLIGSGRGGTLAHYRNDGEGNFEHIPNSPFSFQLQNDLSAIIGWHGNNRTRVLTGNFYYENEDASSAPFFAISQSDNSDFQLDTLVTSPYEKSATGPMALADIDSDNDLDLFLGKHVIPSKFPLASTSLLLENKNGTFQKNDSRLSVFSDLGIVSDATFSDLDQDGDPDLLVALQWGPIKVFENDNGNFHDISKRSFSVDMLGRWNSISTGDFNNDGLADIVATNQGLNDFLFNDEQSRKYLYFGDFNQKNKAIEIVEGYYAEGIDEIVPKRKLRLLGSEIPIIGKQFYSFEQFSKSTINSILGSYQSAVDTLKVNRGKTTVFLNQGNNRFEPVKLPPEVQFTTSYSAVVADYNGDGNEDIFLSQNFFGTRIQDKRKDGGRGQLLLGRGNGSFDVLPSKQSGIAIYGEQRGAAVSDINNDHRIDLVVTQNSGKTRLFKNQQAKKGITVTLVGKKENPDAIGGSAQLIYENGTGPLREIKAGAGYWSQSTNDLILGYKHYPTAIKIKWPDGTTEKYKLRNTTNHLIIKRNGEIKYLH